MTWLLLTIIVVLGLTLLTTALLTHRAVRELRAAADRFAQGDLSQRINLHGPPQLASLATSMNAMAAQLEDRLATVVQDRNELEAVLSSMVEGVIVIDLDERVFGVNRAAAALLRLDATQAMGRSIQESIRNAPLQAFVRQTLRDNAASQSEFTLRLPDEPRERFLQAQSAILRDAGGERIGAVIVLHDVTELRRLESIRRDFVANVSHEVRTPVSAIKAAVETLLDGDPHDPEMTERLLRIVTRQADRLAAIVEDLLSLARIEQEASAIFGDLALGPLRPALAGAVETCHAKAEARQIEVTLRCDRDLRARINPLLLEQAVVNLIENAIKYSGTGTRVDVEAAQHDQELVISVIDRGRGIESEHLPRVFERFYRTDQARNRDAGGTGLGLSIVKHVVQAHGGRVSAESTLGKGSTFRIHLPAITGGAPSRSGGERAESPAKEARP